MFDCMQKKFANNLKNVDFFEKTLNDFSLTYEMIKSILSIKFLSSIDFFKKNHFVLLLNLDVENCRFENEKLIFKYYKK